MLVVGEDPGQAITLLNEASDEAGSVTQAKRRCDLRSSSVSWSAFGEAVRSAPEECVPADTHRDDLAIWLFTSGSTGHPKGAVHLQHDLPYNTEVYAKQTLGCKR